MAAFSHPKPWGSEIIEGGARFRIWAPSQKKMSLVVERDGRTQPMRREADGWFEIETDAVAVGEGYRYELADGFRVPDAAARAQVGDVHGPSRLIDPCAYDWKSAEWKGRPWEEAVIYELHTGTFTAEGNFDGVRRRLDELADLGVTVIELMPVAQFSGNRGWGYDGVLFYAPHIAYGGPDSLKRLIDEAHQRGLMMALDVVYNHFGPDGNYLHAYAKEFFHPERKTPWGDAMAFETRAVRDYFVHNVLFWLQEYRFDVLRFDAIDALDYSTEEPILEEMARAAHLLLEDDRHFHLTTEDDRNITRLHERDSHGRPKLFTAEWNDDWHHATHVLLTGETHGYYEDYADKPAEQIARGMAEGYIFQGEASVHRDGEARGEPSTHLPPTSFVNFIQNHDQIGNRAVGDRVTSLAKREAVEAMLALLLLSPQIPLLYMGEEDGEETPFLFFTDFHGELGKLVREGRREEFRRRMPTFVTQYDTVPDPNAVETFERSKLPSGIADKPQRGPRREFVKNLLKLRREQIVPRFGVMRDCGGTYEMLGETAFRVDWRLGDGTKLTVHANVSDKEATIPQAAAKDILFAHPKYAASSLASGRMPAWSVVWIMKP